MNVKNSTFKNSPPKLGGETSEASGVVSMRTTPAFGHPS